MGNRRENRKMKILAFTDNGLKYDHNEDCYSLNGVCRYGEKLCGEKEIYSAAVFDGVGGANAGEIASKLACETAAMRITPQFTAQDLKFAFAEVNSAVVNASRSKADYGGMACTVAGVLFREDETIVYNIGDSKVFKIKNGLMMQLSSDDTYSASLARAYGEKCAEIENDHTITAYLGNPHYNAEQLHLSAVSPFCKGETYFICTDGVTDYIDYNYLKILLTDSEISLEEKSKKISRAVFSNGAKDNLTYIILTR